MIAGATFALFSSSVTNDINVNTGDIAISSTVELTNAWSTSQGGEQDPAENSGSETSLIFPATGGKFLHFDPSKGDDSSTSNGGSNSSVQGSYLAEGYVSVASGEYFIVQKA